MRRRIFWSVSTRFSITGIERDIPRHAPDISILPARRNSRLQCVPASGHEVLPPTIADIGDDARRRALALASTVEDHELLDPALSPERLLYRLFHEEEMRAFNASPLSARCNCSRERVENMLGQFSTQELEGMAEGNIITVTCEFCNSRYSMQTAM
jgi:redox-regulated HSP33 family molecular chaperone